MALPVGSSSIQTAVLQLSRDLQQAISKAKTSLSAVATQACAPHTGSDSALPTSREGIFTRNLGSENTVTSSSLLAALDIPRTHSLTDRAEEAQPEEGVEVPGATTNAGCGNSYASRQDGFSAGSRRVTPLFPHSRGAEHAVNKEFQVEIDTSDEKNSDNSFARDFRSQHTTVSSAPSAVVSVTGESTSANEQSSFLSIGKGNSKNSEERYNTAKWLHLTSPAGSSLSLLAQRGSNKVSSTASSVLSLSSSLPAPGVSDSEPAARFSSLCSSCPFETPSSPFTDFQDAVNSPYRRNSTGNVSSQGFRALVTTDARQHLQRKKLTSSLACCSTGSSSCAPPLLSAALLLSPPHQQKLDKSMLQVNPSAEKETIAPEYASSYNDLKTGSYTSVANPANSRLAEVENKWFFVDILGDVPSLVEERPSQEQSVFAIKKVATDSTHPDLVQHHMPEEDLGVTEGNSGFLLPEADSNSGSKTVGECASSCLLADMSIGTSRDEDIHPSTCMLPATNVGDHSGSAQEYGQAIDILPLPGTLNENNCEKTLANSTVKLPSFMERRKHDPYEIEKVGETSCESMQEHPILHGLHQARVLHHHRDDVHHEQEKEKLRRFVSERGRAHEQEDKRVSSGAAEEVKRREKKLIPRLCSDSSIAGTALRVASPSPCSSSSTTASSIFSKYGSQQPLLQLGLRVPYPFERSPELQPLSHRQHQEVQERQPAVNSAAEEGVTLLGAALRSSVERNSGGGVTVGRRRHRMQKAEGTTSFASLEAMVEFVRNSTSLYGYAALEGVTFHVPAEDAESLVSALEETLPYSWRDLRSAALEALKPLTALVVGRFVLLQLPSLLLELAGSAAAENAAAAAAVAAEASGLSAVLAIAPWLIVFGGCVYAIIRGAHALQASRRAQFLIFENGEVQTPRNQRQCQDTRVNALPGIRSFFVADSSTTTSHARTAALGAVREDLRITGSSAEVSAGVVDGASVQSGAVAGSFTTAVQASQLADAENVGAELGEEFQSDSSKESDIEEKHPLLKARVAGEQMEEVAHWGCSSSSMREVNPCPVSGSSTSIVDLLGCTNSRANSIDGNYNVAAEEFTTGNREDDLYLKSSGSVESGGGSGLGSVRGGADGLGPSLGKSSATVYTDTGDDRLRSNGSGGSSDEIKVLCLPDHYTKGSGARQGASAADASRHPTSTVMVEDYVTVRRDRRRPSQEEEALQQQLLTCSADWRDRNFSFEV